MRWRLAGGFGPDVAPQTQTRPAGRATDRDVVHVSAPTVSTTTCAPPSVSSFTRAATSSRAWFTVASAPNSLARASFASDDDVTTARAPSESAVARAPAPTPPTTAHATPDQSAFVPLLRLRLHHPLSHRLE